MKSEVGEKFVEGILQVEENMNNWRKKGVGEAEAMINLLRYYSSYFFFL